MESRLNPYLVFGGQARAAMEYYQKVFGGELNIQSFGDMGQTDPALKDNVMHAMLVTGSGFTIMASDTPPGMEARGAGNVAIALSGDNGEELRRYWAGLSDGGSVQTALERQMWGDEFGQCVDRFGVEWMVNIASP
ncbi:VOC family protein [Actinomadura logoneensis]|uniref:VOC family protein n=1 Tax=Actinomadura logoneensis TaxID=2293572 RepID=A0A372JDZ6_9ACTN|nr:VOC family protein [Actinomadura logoneensis]RFU38026.1 VOC family protein [Actinomadura logoneensis]